MIGWYQASKHALSAVSDALRREVTSSGVDVVLVEPGGFRTEIWDKAEQDLVRRRTDSLYAKAYGRSLAILRTFRPIMGHPRDVAEVIGDALTAGRPRAHYRVGVDAQLLHAAHRLLPERARDRVLQAVLGL
jgi:short-subunit dehydrogenase